MIIKNENDSLIPEQSKQERSYVVFLTNFIGIKRNFRCVNCGKLLFKYDNELQAIHDRGEKPLRPGTEHFCTRCNATAIVIVIE